MFAAGIFLSWPMERWGCHRVAFVCGVASFLGLALSSLAPSVSVLYITQGLIRGQCGTLLFVLNAHLMLLRSEIVH